MIRDKDVPWVTTECSCDSATHCLCYETVLSASLTQSITRVPSAPANRRLVVVGAGIAGLEAARSLALRHPSAHVTLFEASSTVGGRVRQVSVTP